MRNLLRFWFTFEQPVDRVTYLVHGTVLMAVKFTVDVALVRAVTGMWWSPIDYGRAIQSVTELSAAGGPAWLAWAMLLWMLPFVAIGATLTLRRCVDAGFTGACSATLGPCPNWKRIPERRSAGGCPPAPHATRLR